MKMDLTKKDSLGKNKDIYIIGAGNGKVVL